MITKSQSTETPCQRITCQKEIILNYLKGVKIHPSAEKVFSSVRKKLPRISQATVYRILKNFKEEGKIKEIPSQVSHYDADLSPHAHFICDKCNKIFDIFEECNLLKLKKTKVGRIKSHQIYFYGQCKNCK